MSDSVDQPVCAVVGVGPGNGAAFARRFSTAGYRVALVARNTEFTQSLAQELPDARAYGCDITDPGEAARTFAAIRDELGEVEVLIYNPGIGVWGSVEEITPEAFETSWRTNAFGALLAAQQVIPGMRRKGRGSILMIGATASRRGVARTAAFAPAKAAQRSLAESMARHLWPSGIHVALVILDGVVDTPYTREMMPGKPDSYFIQPNDIAENLFWLTRQPRSAWSFEIEARPYGESW